MAPRKRGHAEISSDASDDSSRESPPLLKRIRDNWQFACFMQFVQFFGSALKIDNELDIDMLEEECLKPNSEKLAQLALTLLKWVSSHRGLTLDIFDEYTRRQYLAKAPHLNPFGEEEDALKFADMDVFTKLRVLHQLSVWTLHNPDRIRERMPESTDKEQIQWRIEALGEDRDGRHYYLLDDNRLYRMTDPPQAKPRPKKAKAKPTLKKSGSRASKRQKVISDTEMDDEENEEAAKISETPDDSLGGAKWECMAVTLEEYRDVITRFRKGKHVDEKEIASVLEEEAMPELLKAEESKARKEQKRQRDFDSLQKMATAKRSSRLADKQEKQRQDEEVRAAELKYQQELDMAHKEQERQMKAEKDRESRMMTREQRIRDREMRRILHEEELSKIQERSQSVDSSEAHRMSERNRAQMLDKKQKDLQKLKEEEQDDWAFDCEVCGVHGKNIDDGTHSIACDRCNVWQHSQCNNITPVQADREDFKFICSHCKKPKTNIKLKLKGQSSPSDAKAPNDSPAPDVKPIVKVPQPGSSTSPPMGMFKPTPTPTPMAKHPYVNGTSQQPRAQPAPISQAHSSVRNSLSPSSYRNLPPVMSQAQTHSSSSPYHSISPGPTYKPVYPSQSQSQDYSHPTFHHYQPSYQPYHNTLSQSTTQPSHPRPSSSSSSYVPNGVPPTYNQPNSANQTFQAHSPMSNGIAPHHPSTFTSPAHHAPTPSLSATQGNTSLRFSPTAQPPASPSRHSGSANLANSPGAAQAYKPNTAFPQQSAASPIKQASPPTSSFGSNPASSFTQPAIPPGSPTKSGLAPQTPAQGHSGMNLDGAVPTLSPSVNANSVKNDVPVKKATPVKSPVPHAQDVVMGGVTDGTSPAMVNRNSMHADVRTTQHQQTE